MREFAPAYVTDPDKAIYRIYRDTRFSKDKTPYKDHIGASFHSPQREARRCRLLRCHVSQRDRDRRRHLYARPRRAAGHSQSHRRKSSGTTEDFEGARAQGTLRRNAGRAVVARAKGFCSEHPAADLLRFKRFFFYVELAPELATTPEFFPETVNGSARCCHFSISLGPPGEARQARRAGNVAEHGRH